MSEISTCALPYIDTIVCNSYQYRPLNSLDIPHTLPSSTHLTYHHHSLLHLPSSQNSQLEDHPDLAEVVDSLITEEMESMPSPDHSATFPCLSFSFDLAAHPVLAAEWARVSAGTARPADSGIDDSSSPTAELTPPTAQSTSPSAGDLAAWQAVCSRAGTAIEELVCDVLCGSLVHHVAQLYSRGALLAVHVAPTPQKVQALNLELMTKHGPDVWKRHCEDVEAIQAAYVSGLGTVLAWRSTDLLTNTHRLTALLLDLHSLAQRLKRTRQDVDALNTTRHAEQHGVAPRYVPPCCSAAAEQHP